MYLSMTFNLLVLYISLFQVVMLVRFVMSFNRASYSVARSTIPVCYSTSGPNERKKKRVLSGVQPTGNLHIGNYLGAIDQWVKNQELYDNYFCVVDLHAITAPHDPRQLRENTLRSAAVYLAAGIDPAKSCIFVQSHVRAHVELAWLLNCITPINWLERMIQFKGYHQKYYNQPNVNFSPKLNNLLTNPI